MDQATLDRLTQKYADYTERVAQLRGLLNIPPEPPIIKVVVSECWFCRFKAWFKEYVIGIRPLQ